ncbi:MAG: hypothetical protein H6832_06160 [Planctomycetes bacterium]|nr:hypothetical protein [Planctomycetota bacterium]MCB9917969.1 hypothetical protein [Planctomycetota bacterium]
MHESDLAAARELVDRLPPTCRADAPTAIDYIFANQEREDGYGVMPTPFADEIVNELLKRGYDPLDCHFRFEDPVLLEDDRSSVKRFLNGPVELCNPGRGSRTNSHFERNPERRVDP